MKMRTNKILAVLLLPAFLCGCAGKTPGSAEPENTTENKELVSDVTSENISEYDFTEQAMIYLEYLGTKLPDRDSTKKDGDHEAAMEWIISELRNAGYSDGQIEKQSFSYEGFEGTNVILTVEGEDRLHQIIAGAHYDGDGTGDNGSGVALLLANAVGLAGKKPHYTVKYIFFDCEEIGLLGSFYSVENMSDTETANTLYMINIDSVAFGDYCNIYGGFPGYEYVVQEKQPEPEKTEAYEFAADVAESLGFSVMRTADLDGYFAKHGTGPEIKEKTLYTNPWTNDNPPPSNYVAASPATIPASDHVGYMMKDIPYIYFEATNWFVEGEELSYLGYFETYDKSLGEGGMFMNTEYDTWENLNKFFPGRAEQHFRIYSPLLSALIMKR